MEDAKEIQLLEGILGCAPEHLANISDEEINKAVEALQHVLTWKSFKLPWQDITKEDLSKIRNNANDRYIYKSTGRTALSNIFRKHSDLEERLIDNNYLPAGKSLGDCSDEELAQAVNKYFYDIMAEALASGDAEAIQKSYDKALKIYGDILIDTQDARQKEILTAAISNLSIQGREVAAKISIISCSNDVESRAQVARGLFNNHMEITCTYDALGEVMQQEAATNISNIAFLHMSEEDSKLAYQKLDYEAATFFAQNRALIEQLKQKDPATLTTAEKELLLKASNGYLSQYAGALTAIQYNVNISDENEFLYLTEISNSAKKIGIANDVYQAVSNYITQYPESIAAKDCVNFVKLIDKITNGEYSATTENFDNLYYAKANNLNKANQSNNISSQTKEDERLAVKPQSSHSDNSQKIYSNKNYNNDKTYNFVSNPILADTKVAKSKEVVTELQVDNKLITAVRAGEDSFETYLEENGIFKTVIEVFNNIRYIPEKWVIEKSLRIYENYSPIEQANTLICSNNSALIELLKKLYIA